MSDDPVTDRTVRREFQVSRKCPVFNPPQATVSHSMPVGGFRRPVRPAGERHGRVPGYARGAAERWSPMPGRREVSAAISPPSGGRPRQPRAMRDGSPERARSRIGRRLPAESGGRPMPRFRLNRRARRWAEEERIRVSRNIGIHRRSGLRKSPRRKRIILTSGGAISARPNSGRLGQLPR